MKSLINLCMALLADAGRICSVDTYRDLKTIRTRSKHEGISFFTITLPNFADDFERSLEQGLVDSTLYSGWKKSGCLPVFLRGFTNLVFTERRLRDDAASDAVFCIRQICRCFKKVRLPCSIERERLAYEKYRHVEAALAEWQVPCGDAHEHFRSVCDYLWSNVFGVGFNTFDLVPRHGPGATCERVSGNAKFTHALWYARVDRVFPATEFKFTSVNHLLCSNDGIDKTMFIAEPDEKPVRVISVPKTLKAPRIIAIEPVCMQYTQQAVGRWIMKMIQRSELTKESIRFDDQSVNQHMAVLGSRTGRLGTIDLSDASDRVPLSMVRLMLHSCPDLLEAVEACRSTRAELPNGDILPLGKFASMGSALCFPIESMYFYTLIVHALLWSRGLPPSHSNILNVTKWVHVYGDDLIIPIDQIDIVVSALTTYNCKVNVRKSFWKGKFRESCGADAFCGVDVTPIYLREMRPDNKQDSSGIVSWISTSNLFHKAGMWKAADFMKSEVERLLGSLPVVADTSPGLGWYSFIGVESSRMCKFLHKPLVYTYKVQPNRRPDPLDGYPALLKFFLRVHSAETECSQRPLSVDKKHLTHSARFGTVGRKRRWVPST